MNAAKTLGVWIEGTPVGTLAVEQGTWAFEYAESYTSAAGAVPLSPYFPLTIRAQVDAPDDRRVEWYFENLLPEGAVRQALAQFAGLYERDTFGLLGRFGEESAGALTILPAGARPKTDGEDVVLSDEELRALLRDLPHSPLIAARGRMKMSLAGAQQKLGVRFRDGRLFLPRGGAASTHILKPDNARPEAYPFCPANEHFVMSLARAVGVAVPTATLLHLSEPVYIIERYDRWLEEGVVRRRHQIDLCQMLNKWPSYKYEIDGGATIDDVFGAADRTRQPAMTRSRLLRWVIFNYLVGNSDAHAKNVSFLVSSDGVDLAPSYDLLSVRVYGDDTLAMNIGGEDRYGLVTAAAWDEFARRVGIRPAVVRQTLSELARSLPQVAAAWLSAPEYTSEERTFLERVVATIREHAEFVEQGL